MFNVIEQHDVGKHISSVTRLGREGPTRRISCEAVRIRNVLVTNESKIVVNGKLLVVTLLSLVVTDETVLIVS